MYLLPVQILIGLLLRPPVIGQNYSGSGFTTQMNTALTKQNGYVTTVYRRLHLSLDTLWKNMT